MKDEGEPEKRGTTSYSFASLVNVEPMLLPWQRG